MKIALCFRFAQTLLKLASLVSEGQFFQRPDRTQKKHCNQREKRENFYYGVVTRRHSFGLNLFLFR